MAEPIRLMRLAGRNEAAAESLQEHSCSGRSDGRLQLAQAEWGATEA